MATLRIRDPYGREFDIDATARPFWEGREGYTILASAPSPGDEQERPTELQLDPSGAPKTSSKAAPRPAPKVEE
ncbi:hypothetical protein GCM10017673_56440 [Streptosporangium violaceochromogenes]|nr:hypothetical protein GCM10017673_56440 [Streptosporangium violaceochromogenes]